MSGTFSHTRIKKLSPLLINQLAAGEVVTRPASVVKELLENAIDAGATLIEIRITQGGMGMIEVTDNGSGIHSDDMVMAITRHATSKVADVAHLQGIETLGFRGEALAATAAVSRLSLTSSADDSGIGRQLHVAGVLDDKPLLTPVVHNRGTTVTVKDLYFNVPARRGNLKSIATEFAYIESIVREMALVYADVTLHLFHDGKKRLSLLAHIPSQQNAIESHYLPISRLEQALALSLNEEALSIDIDLSSLISRTDESVMQSASISGWLWATEDKSAALPKLLYINGRLIKEALIANQLRQMASRAQIENIGYALYFKLPPTWLNLNVHPSKQRIKISPLNNIMAHLSHHMATLLNQANDSKRSASATSASPLPYETTDYQLASQSVQASIEVQSQKHTYQPLDSLADTRDIVPPQYRNRGDLFVQDHGDDAPVETALSEQHYEQDSISLPICIEQITHLANNNLSVAGLENEQRLSSLPWLLFYHQGQLVLISAADWHLNFNKVFDYECNLDNKSVNSVITINQQLSAYAAQMSAQDQIAFEVDITDLLTNNALRQSDTHQLVQWMLADSR